MTWPPDPEEIEQHDKKFEEDYGDPVKGTTGKKNTPEPDDENDDES